MIHMAYLFSNVVKMCSRHDTESFIGVSKDVPTLAMLYNVSAFYQKHISILLELLVITTRAVRFGSLHTPSANLLRSTFGCV